MTFKQVKQKFTDYPTNWSIHLTDFVDDFRYYRDQWMIEESFELDSDRFDALLAATATWRFDGADPPQSIEAENRGAFSHRLVKCALLTCGR